MRQIAIVAALIVALPVLADESKPADEQSGVGSCEQATEQVKYWCEERQQVTVVSTGLECENAKRNFKEACEGVKSEDHKYQ